MVAFKIIDLFYVNIYVAMNAILYFTTLKLG